MAVTFYFLTCWRRRGEHENLCRSDDGVTLYNLHSTIHWCCIRLEISLSRCDVNTQPYNVWMILQHWVADLLIRLRYHSRGRKMNMVSPSRSLHSWSCWMLNFIRVFVCPECVRIECLCSLMVWRMTGYHVFCMAPWIEGILGQFLQYPAVGTYASKWSLRFVSFRRQR